MTEKTYTHDPDAVLDYAYDWTAWLADGETIANYEIVPSAGVTVDSDAEDAGIVTVWVSAAEPRIQRVTCRIVTSQGRTDDRTIKLDVRSR